VGRPSSREWSDLGHPPSPATNYGANFCWAYDSFGNRTQQVTSNAVFATESSSCSTTGAIYQNTVATYNNAQNQISSTNAGGTVVSPTYDAAGNITYDGTNAYLYDGEGRICAVESAPYSGGTVITGYIYDAGGNRVAKGTLASFSCGAAFTVTADYVVAGEEQLTEFTIGSGNAPVWKHTNVYAGGKLIATYDGNGLHFHIADPLGTRRAQTNAAGALEATYQSLPFGDDLTPANLSIDPTENHFTGKERDTESGLDYFDARYYGSSMGRFMSPDPVFASPERVADPQQWNMYAYVRNNPLSRTDPTGLDFNLTCSGGNTATCQGGLQGQTVDGKFSATDVDMNNSKDAGAGYHDQFGNQYTGTFDQNNGVSFTNTSTGDTSSNSRFIDGSDQTNVNGSGAFGGIQGQFNSNCGGSCEAKGSLFDLPGHAGATANLEQMIGKSFIDNLNFFGGHGKADNYRFGDDQLTHIVNHLAGPDAGRQEVHFEGHPPGRDVVNFVLHQVDAIRDSHNHQSANEPRLP
jgi:RHS repeat-associated protein